MNDSNSHIKHLFRDEIDANNVTTIDHWMTQCRLTASVTQVIASPPVIQAAATVLQFWLTQHRSNNIAKHKHVVASFFAFNSGIFASCFAAD